MAERRCEECGTIIPNGATACPNCGCPVEDIQDNEQANKKSWQTESAFIHDNFNEKEPYSPFKSNSWFFKDPWPMYNYPIGALDKKHPFIGWLFGPWHLTCRDSSKQEEYDTINNTFYFFNLHFKIVAYTLVWQFFKIWWLILAILLYIGLNGLIIGLVIQSNMELDTKIIITSIIGFIASVVWIAVAIFNLIVVLCSLCKALHRYWPQIWRVVIRFCKRGWSKMFPKIS